MKSNIYLLSIIALLTFSCESIVTEVELPELPDRIVISTFLSPGDDSIRVTVTESQSLFSDASDSLNKQWLEDADVFITHGSTTRQLAYISSYRYYVIDALAIPILPNETYKVTARATDGREASGEATVPAISDHHIKLEQVTSIQHEGYSEKVISVRFYDPASTQDHYRILMKAVWSKTGFPSSTQDSYPYPESRSEYIEDSNFNGGSLLVNFNDYDDPGYTLDSVYVYLYTTDETYYLFHRSIEANQNSSENPFIEPALVYSNVIGGLGVVSAYNSQVAGFKVP